MKHRTQHRRIPSGIPGGILLLLMFLMLMPGSLAAQMPPAFGLVTVEHPADNPYSEAKAALGRDLFSDPILSADGRISCATCHDPKQAFAKPGEALAVGISGSVGRRNTPSLLNVTFAKSLFFDGRANTLEEQAWQPILADDEMGNTNVNQVLNRLAATSNYVQRFEAVFGIPRPDKASVAMALATFQRTLVSGNSSYDRWNWGEDDAMTALEVRGQNLFSGRAQCWQCHRLGLDPLLLTDHMFHRTGILTKDRGKAADLGRFEFTRKAKDRYRFRTPSLRNVALTPPYMHDGSLATLEEVVKFYTRGEGPDLDPIDLNEEEIASLVAFMKALSSEPPPSEEAETASP